MKKNVSLLLTAVLLTAFMTCGQCKAAEPTASKNNLTAETTKSTKIKEESVKPKEIDPRYIKRANRLSENFRKYYTEEGKVAIDSQIEPPISPEEYETYGIATFDACQGTNPYPKIMLYTFSSPDHLPEALDLLVKKYKCIEWRTPTTRPDLCYPLYGYVSSISYSELGAAITSDMESYIILGYSNRFFLTSGNVFAECWAERACKNGICKLDYKEE